MPFLYPETRIQTVKAEMHGQLIVDHYQWLEDLDSSETKVWTQEQNQFMRETIDQIPLYQTFTEHLEELYGVEQLGTVKVVKDRVFYTRIAPGQDQPVLYYRQEGEGAEAERVLIDPNQENQKGTVALSFWYPSKDGTYLAYGLSLNGEEWAPVQILDVETGEILVDKIERTRYPNICWRGNEGFYYSRHPRVGEVPEGEENYHPKIYYHQLGDDWLEDQVIYGQEVPKNVTPRPYLTKDENYLLLYLTEGWRKTELYVTDLRKEINWVPLITGYDGLFGGRVVDETMYLMTNYQSPNYRIVAFDLEEALRQGQSLSEDWETIVAEEESISLQEFVIVGQQLVCPFLRDASYGVMICQLDGSQKQEVALPQLGSLAALDSSEVSGQVYLVAQSFVQPPMIYRLDLQALELTPWTGGEGVEAQAFENIQIEQHFYQSKDGTEVPLFLVRRKDLTLDQPRPTVLHGYGGFNISLTPFYHPGFLSWVEQGGVLAIANLRGGSEYGESWHRAGMLDQKQNVFDDFIWAGKYLIQEGYTDEEHLGIYGRSNGGLLVGATMTQVPKMVRAVVCQVPLLDMARYHKFLAGGYWVGEYGDPEKADEFEWVYRYSPYHQYQPSEDDPAVFFVTAVSDTRVHPLHAMKMAALMQHESRSGHPVLLKVESESGHGAGKPIRKMIEEQAEIWAFMGWQLGLGS